LIIFPLRHARAALRRAVWLPTTSDRQVDQHPRREGSTWIPEQLTQRKTIAETKLDLVSCKQFINVLIMAMMCHEYDNEYDCDL